MEKDTLWGAVDAGTACRQLSIAVKLSFPTRRITKMSC